METLLSVIIPAHNEEKRLPESLQNIVSFIDVQPFQSEIIIVENGSTDSTYTVAEELANRDERISVLSTGSAGKGLAVQTGMLAATGKYRLMADADWSMPVEEIPRFIKELDAGADIVIASREAVGAKRYDEPFYRNWGGRAINLFARTVLSLPYRDTQCGFKCFTDESAKSLFGRLNFNGWSFDIEILFMAKKAGFSIKVLPIPWYYNEDSKVKPVADAALMIADICTIKINELKSKYANTN